MPTKQNRRKDIKLFNMIICVMKLKGIYLFYFSILFKLSTKTFYKKSENVSSVEKVKPFKMRTLWKVCNFNALAFSNFSTLTHFFLC